MIPAFNLDKTEPVASGSQRFIYRHPTNPARLIKVLRDTPETAGRSRLAVWAERNIPSQKNMWVRKEYSEYLRMMLSSTRDDFHPPIAHLYGFVQTTRGLGCMTDAVLDKGGLGETLGTKLRQGSLDAADLSLLNDTICRLYTYDIRAGDMTARNFVFGQRDLGGGLGPRECVLVDGFGDIHAVPYRSWGRRLNRIGLNDSCKRLARKKGLDWHPQIRQFQLND
jgi:hypothetical protein